MSKSLGHMLQVALEAHRVPSHWQDGKLVVGDGLLQFHTHLKVHKTDPGSALVQVSIATEAFVLNGNVIWNSFAGYGPDEEAAIKDGFAKFLLGPFHVLLAAFGDHICKESNEEWTDLKAKDGSAWRICSSALVTQGFEDPSAVPFTSIEKALIQAFAPQGTTMVHWIELFFAFLNSDRTHLQVEIDGLPWPEGASIVEAWSFRPSAGYRSGRYFAVALKSAGLNDEQREEVRSRLRDVDAPSMTLETFRDRVRKMLTRH